MMNPAMVEESEEAIEKFIVGETQPTCTHSIDPSVEYASASANHQNVSTCVEGNNSELPSFAAAVALQPIASFSLSIE